MSDGMMLVGALGLVGYAGLSLLALRSKVRAGKVLLSGNAIGISVALWVIFYVLFSFILTLEFPFWLFFLITFLNILPVVWVSRVRLGEFGLQTGYRFIPRNQLLGFRFLNDDGNRVEFFLKAEERYPQAAFSRKLSRDEVQERLAKYFAP
ncbi:hypothetical protein [Gorillibacterium timonense]|uniref:hypothetical protein n=1 Tax=Gorillibacterium timonense TaxID=1689269 RepID=UPI00071C672F|nr:hypothetical protein [Gorillibacterium timonense]